MKYILLAIALLFNMCVQAQETTKAKAYSAESFYELDSERLADKDVKELADNDVDEIKRIIREVRWLNKTSKPLGAGVFVEFKPKEGLYLGYNGFAAIDSLGLIIQSYSYPKKSRSRIKEIIDSYYISPSAEKKLKSYYDYPLSVVSISSNLCYFNPIKDNVNVLFYVKISNEYVPVYYRIGKAKNDSLIVSRSISLWHRIDNINDLSKIYKNGKKEIDEHILTKLLALIPKWDFMSDSEKMKFLDSHLSPAK